MAEPALKKARVGGGSKGEEAGAKVTVSGKSAAGRDLRQGAGRRAASDSLPLACMTLVFSGKLSQTRPKMNAAAKELGAATAGSISGRTTALVVGKNAGDKEYEANLGGIAIWTEEEYDAVCAGGDPPAMQFAPWADAIMAEDSPVPLECRAALAKTLEMQLAEGDESGPISAFCPSSMRPHRHKGRSPTVSEYGAAVLAPALRLFPGNTLFFSHGVGDDLRVEDLDIILQAVRERDSALQSIRTINVAGSNLGDPGAACLAKHIPHIPGLEKVYAYGWGITSVGMRQLLDAVAACTSFSCLEVQGNLPGSEASVLVAQWRKDTGCQTTVLSE